MMFWIGKVPRVVLVKPLFIPDLVCKISNVISHRKMSIMSTKKSDSNKFYGLDGDKVGGIIDAYFIRNEVDAVRIFSIKVAAAMEEIRKIVIQNNGVVIFCAGDSILFQGYFENLWCSQVLALFRDMTGCTASIGIGDTATEAYLGMKLAKASGGGKAVPYSLR